MADTRPCKESTRSCSTHTRPCRQRHTGVCPSTRDRVLVVRLGVCASGILAISCNKWDTRPCPSGHTVVSSAFQTVCTSCTRPCLRRDKGTRACSCGHTVVCLVLLRHGSPETRWKPTQTSSKLKLTGNMHKWHF